MKSLIKILKDRRRQTLVRRYLFEEHLFCRISILWNFKKISGKQLLRTVLFACNARTISLKFCSTIFSVVKFLSRFRFPDVFTGYRIVALEANGINQKASFTLLLVGKVIMIRPKKNSRLRVTRKIFTRTNANSFFNRFSGDLFFFSFFYFFCILVFLLVCVFFEIKNIYSEYTRLCGRLSDKKITRPISGNKTTVLFGLTKVIAEQFHQRVTMWRLLINSQFLWNRKYF